MPKVIVGKSRQCSKYHKNNGQGKPNCDSGIHMNNPEWKLWEKAKAEVWKEPCQRAKCYGDPIERDGQGKPVWP